MRAAVRKTTAAWEAPNSFHADPARVLHPVDFGADPTCTRDSSDAFSQITAALGAMAVGNMSDSNRDLGGATVDLQGSCYLLSSTWAIPQWYSNWHVTFGELRAAPSFPPNGTLVQVGTDNCTTWQHACNQNAAFHGVTFDGAHLAGTTLAIYFTMGAVVDSSSVFLNFAQNGILLHSGHESMISDTWIAAYPWSSPMRRHVTSVGINLASYDAYITNTIVYSAQIGVLITGAANVLNGEQSYCSMTCSRL